MWNKFSIAWTDFIKIYFQVSSAENTSLIKTVEILSLDNPQDNLGLWGQLPCLLPGSIPSYLCEGTHSLR
jgi:hypothetical protein